MSGLFDDATSARLECGEQILVLFPPLGDSAAIAVCLLGGGSFRGQSEVRVSAETDIAVEVGVGGVGADVDVGMAPGLSPVVDDTVVRRREVDNVSKCGNEARLHQPWPDHLPYGYH